MMSGPREIIANLERLHHLMDQAHYAAVVVRSGKNVTYLSGCAYPGTLARHLDFPDSPREVLLVWPRQGEPVLITNHDAAPLAQRDSWLSRIEIYEGFQQGTHSVSSQFGS
jgi:Xaa-Pro aminopeptidase